MNIWISLLTSAHVLRLSLSLRCSCGEKMLRVRSDDCDRETKNSVRRRNSIHTPGCNSIHKGKMQDAQLSWLAMKEHDQNISKMFGCVSSCWHSTLKRTRINWETNLKIKNDRWINNREPIDPFIVYAVGEDNCGDAFQAVNVSIWIVGFSNFHFGVWRICFIVIMFT